MANWSGTWPGLVGMLNLNGSLTKAGKKYSTLWSEDFTDEFFVKNLQQVAREGRGQAHDARTSRRSKKVKVPAAERKLGEALAAQLAREKAIMGIFDEGCMGMYNAIIPDDLLQPDGRVTRNGSASRPCTTRPRRSATTRPAPSASGWTTAA